MTTYITTIIDEIEYKMFSHVKGHAVRVKDIDSGENVGGIKIYPTIEKAIIGFEKLTLKALNMSGMRTSLQTK